MKLTIPKFQQENKKETLLESSGEANTSGILEFGFLNG